MASSEFSRSPQPGGRRRPLGALIIVVVLCLMAFLLGIFVGKQRTVVPESVVETSSIPHFTATKPIAQPTVATGAVVQVQSTIPVAAVTVGSGIDKKQTALPVPKDQQVADPIKQLISSVEQSPLGSGMNPAAVLAPEPVTDVVTAGTDVISAPAVTTPVEPLSPAVKLTQPPLLNKVAYLVQVGSFKHRHDAEKVQKKLQSKFSVVVKRVDLVAKGIWFRVLVGPVATKDAAVTLKKELHDQYKLSGFVKKMTL